mmetsp:Transcript_19413/g.33314  ORF Transcript_19413/g.33314 Transcript_19413/m.33314 type:complete len:107 (-) Transcript_19413:6-326(-)
MSTQVHMPEVSSNVYWKGMSRRDILPRWLCYILGLRIWIQRRIRIISSSISGMELRMEEQRGCSMALAKGKFNLFVVSEGTTICLSFYNMIAISINILSNEVFSLF